MEDQALIQCINNDLGLMLSPQTSFADLRRQLQVAINDMIKADFDRLVNVLYRVDVNERKLKYLLQENVGEDAAVIIADLIISRQLEKITSRNQFNQQDGAAEGEERW